MELGNSLEVLKQKEIETKANVEILSKKLKENAERVKIIQKCSYKEYEKMLQEPLCRRINRMMKHVDILSTNNSKDYVDLALSEEEIGTLNLIVNKHCPNFTALLKQFYPKMNRVDLQQCRFYLLGFNDMQIAVMLKTNFTTIWKRSRHLKQSMSGCEDPSLQIKSILFEEK